MPAISTRVHGLLDYLLGACLLGSPFLLGLDPGELEAWVPMALGAVLIGYSLFTGYEYGALKRIDPQLHLWLDAGLGLVLAVSPWLIGFYREAWVPHLAVGALLVVSAGFSHTIPGYDRRGGAA
ncbi:MAG: SPW repeat domain-containing protein [Longimicrobiaceae bacterium]